MCAFASICVLVCMCMTVCVCLCTSPYNERICFVGLYYYVYVYVGVRMKIGISNLRPDSSKSALQSLSRNPSDSLPCPYYLLTLAKLDHWNLFRPTVDWFLIFLTFGFRPIFTNELWFLRPMNIIYRRPIDWALLQWPHAYIQLYHSLCTCVKSPFCTCDFGAVHKVRHARGGRGSEKVWQFVTGRWGVKGMWRHT